MKRREQRIAEIPKRKMTFFKYSNRESQLQCSVNTVDRGGSVRIYQKKNQKMYNF